MIKEVILKDVGDKSKFVTYDDIIENVKEEIHEAMDIYAEQQSIAFAEWTEREDYTLVFETNLWGTLGSRQNYTTSQLYKLFLKNKTND